MLWFAAINLVAAMLVLGVSYWSATDNALDFYPSTLVVMYNAIAAAVAALLAMLLKSLRLLGILIASLLLMGLPLSCAASMEGWPGGDDGGAFGWMFFVGIGSLLAAVAGVVTGVVALFRWAANRRTSDIRGKNYGADG